MFLNRYITNLVGYGNMIPIDRPYLNTKGVFAGISKKPIETLEKSFAEYIGRRYVIYTSYCRTALYLIYKSLKLKGEVIVSPLTCSVAILPIILSGLKPFFTRSSVAAQTKCLSQKMKKQEA